MSPAGFAAAAARSAPSIRSRDAHEIEADRPGRLEHEVDRAQLERAKRRFVSAARRAGAQHHDGPRHLAHDVAERAQAVELRHVDVERHDVRLERMHLLQRVVAVARRADDGELTRALDDLRRQAPHEGAVVDDEDARELRGHASPCAAIALRRDRRR